MDLFRNVIKEYSIFEILRNLLTSFNLLKKNNKILKINN